MLVFGVVLAVVRRDADLQVAVSEDARTETLGGDLGATCQRLAKAALGLDWEKDLGGAGSGGVVFKTTQGTVVKCGNLEAAAGLRKEAMALGKLAGLDHVVNMPRYVEEEGYGLLELEFLAALTWKECIDAGPCRTPAGEDCDKNGVCFPVCKTEWGHGVEFLDGPIDKAVAKRMIGEAIEAFMDVCRAVFSQSDATSGMNTMITKDGAIKLIDFEKGHDLGDWHGGVWCDLDQKTIKTRITELTRCLADDDAFKVGAMEIGSALADWDAQVQAMRGADGAPRFPELPRAVYQKSDPAASQELAVAQGAAMVEQALAKLDALEA